MPPETTPPAATPTGILTPGQKSWLFMFLGAILAGLVGRYLPGTPVPPLPAEVIGQVQQMAADVKEIKAQQVQAFKAAGLKQ